MSESLISAGAGIAHPAPGAAPPWRVRDIAAGLCLLALLQAAQAVLIVSHRGSAQSAVGLEVLRFFPTILTAYGILVLAWSRGMRLHHLGFVRPRNWRPALYAWAVSVLAQPAYGVLLALLERDGATFAPASMFGSAGMDGAALSSAVALTAISIVAVVPMVEEIIFRGLVFRGARTRWPLVPSILIAGMLFAAFHFDGPHFVPLVVVGAALAYAYERSGSLWSAILPHAGLNAMSLAVFLARS